MSAGSPQVVLEGAKPNGTARIIHTVLGEKLAESPWKVEAADALQRRTVRLNVTDRGEWVDVVVKPGPGYGVSPGLQIDVRSSSPGKAHVEVSLEMKKIPLILGVPLWHHFPALWEKGGRKLLSEIAGRRVKVKGLFTHPLAVIRMLQVLGVPPGTVG